MDNNKEKEQYTFNVVAAHLLTQNKRSMALMKPDPNAFFPTSPELGCAYRGEDGTRCPVGFCIPNENYTADLEGKRVSHADVLAAISDEHKGNILLLGNLQQVHDSLEVHEWPDFLRNTAKAFSLGSSIVDTFANITVPQPQKASYV